YYWTANEARVRNWRSGAVRVIARYDPDRKLTTTLLRGDPTVQAIERHRDAPTRAAGVASDHKAVNLSERTPGGASSHHPVAIDLDALRR
ncbi:MAG TPA: hypothetical protein VFW47_02545, partial [Phenylobacterium sp.]|nr:hypothetical protein [Phenylobacterium sp.]